MHLDEAILSRRSVRAFRADPAPRALVEELLRIASRSPSGTNVQPWRVHVVAGAVRDRLEAEILRYRDTHPPDDDAEFPRGSNRKEPFLSRMRKLGKDMYGLLEIARGDQVSTWRQWGRNYQFFDAPVGLIFCIDKQLDCMSYIDIGAFAQTFMLLAKSRGLDTCIQGAWNAYWTVTRRVLDIPDDEYLVCGISLGYADDGAPVNRLVSEREPIESFTTFHGF